MTDFQEEARVSLARLDDHRHPGEVRGFTLAPDADTAETQVADADDIRVDLRDRLVAIREDQRPSLPLLVEPIN